MKEPGLNRGGVDIPKESINEACHLADWLQRIIASSGTYRRWLAEALEAGLRVSTVKTYQSKKRRCHIAFIPAEETGVTLDGSAGLRS